ncbi:hypothetical protein AB0D59_17655 [Streptomyces sp. NPDC048417]|uniref:hypothetical protein n=1 Tax=Streptomyces sp. NPDC048417 TaxID=3155387 RepID=UPI00342A5C76
MPSADSDGAANGSILSPLREFMGGLGVVGDLYLVWDATRSWRRGCAGWLVSCDPPPMA